MFIMKVAVESIICFIMIFIYLFFSILSQVMKLLYFFFHPVPSSSVRNLKTSTTQQNATSILVTWNFPVLNDLNGVLLNYSINYSGIEIDTVPRVIYLSNPNHTNQSITLTNLEEYTTYSINVSAYTKVGRSPDAIVTQRTNQDGEYIH